ncbi:uncharacterized protein LOC8079688 isoform X3 [Sorghum bicolor]|uniref:uncharacterized protein LOC8079688 isoform X3 n=1 Tax=Sorghum bicolor TaxID=4558 RepID=UPI000B4242DB|nr:uncharacterized protein LOC8079688 isoform X3 [Sorghum bicolor]|eukprot:XP_021307411.1 uncharacterized protein LOC8079688 isoform X3 [Sorghum bicolor]
MPSINLLRQLHNCCARGELWAAISRAPEAPAPTPFIGDSEAFNFKSLHFEDLDDTLYPFSVGINLACRKNIQDYMRHHLHIEESHIADMCLDLYKEYGTTMAGLKVFTNSDKAHAEEALHRLGLQGCFDGVICFETLNPYDGLSEFRNSMLFPDETSPNLVDLNESDGFRPISPILCKPSIEAMEAVIRIANVDPKKTIFFDDSTRNIASGKAAGFHTVIVGRPTLVPGADHALESIQNMKEALPEIWDGQDWSESDVLSSTAVETVVVA